MMRKPDILFLDFDGVCHPEGCLSARLFEKLPLIEAFLREQPHIEVVISSSWRAYRKLDDLRKHFSPDIATRVVGLTPILARRAFLGSAEAGPRVRELECLQWLQSSSQPDAMWVAIDDQAGLFTPGCTNLITTKSTTGFTEDDLVRLRTMFSAMEAKNAKPQSLRRQ